MSFSIDNLGLYDEMRFFGNDLDCILFRYKKTKTFMNFENEAKC